ncbi:uncharacterized protein EV420DRAFT_70686 [Desarmillaria tabescens]|uniref:Uncharacterized protein n=1 Tax=Armillaria tabescens TaxID=1929756 RepID=A0AA39NQJ5_ARMTA|nr:uncharacterized protein EV420DRAFT_70686 [Desarmillaria tabescens]KAK0469850.1 hypothetical protein EV420DRAFT_70686 [Desarmillaria tabescens]
MAHTAKSKAKGISASSFLDLKAEIAKKEEEFSRKSSSGKKSPKPEKKPTVWARKNKGVSSRAARDIELEAVSKPTLDSARAALERKAKIYDKLKKGKSGGLSEKQFDALLVDFDYKPPEWEDDEDDIDESLTVPHAPDDENDPIIEYEDEFGRIRTAPRSEVPRELLPGVRSEEVDEDEDIIIRNPVNHFPIYTPSADRVAEIEKMHAEESNPLGVHYDATSEVRAKGAGFYQFSGDEETRQKQMEELRAAREKTQVTRQEQGAADVSVEGMVASGSSTGEGVGKGVEKRKREIEERRRMIEAKRRKLKGESAVVDNSAATTTAVSRKDDEETVIFVAGAPEPEPDMTPDPFAAFERQQVTEKSRSKGKGKSRSDEADAFLASLENEILHRKKGK